MILTNMTRDQLRAVLNAGLTAAGKAASGHFGAQIVLNVIENAREQLSGEEAIQAVIAELPKGDVA